MARLTKQHALPALIAVLTVAFLVSIRPAFMNTSGPAVQVGDEAPEFSLMSDSGQAIQLKDFRGKFVVLNFWASYCQPCVEEMPSLKQFQARFASRDLVVLGVSIDEDSQAYENFRRKADLRFLTALDPERKVSHLYGTFKVPETYVIDRRGKVVQKIIGPTNWMDPDMIDFVEQLIRS